MISICIINIPLVSIKRRKLTSSFLSFFIAKKYWKYRSTILNLCLKLVDEVYSVIFGTKYSRMDQVKFVEDSLLKNSKAYGLLKQTISFQIF